MEALADGTLVRFADDVNFIAAANGETFGRWPNALGDLYPMVSPTLGLPNSAPRIGPLVISEVMPAPLTTNVPVGMVASDLEFIEVHNPTGAAVDLTNWQITGGVDFAFAAGQQINSQQRIVVVSFDPTDTALSDAFRDYYSVDPAVVIVGGYSGRLENGGERVRLRRPDSPPVEEPNFIPLLLEYETNYQTVSPWPGTDETGLSMNRTSEDDWGNDPASWIAADPTPGSVDTSTPTVLNVVINDLTDPADLPSGPQPTSWLEQRSALQQLQVNFSRTMLLDENDLVLTNLGINAPADADQVVALTSNHLSLVGSTLTISFATDELQDGVYQLEVLASATDTAGNPIDGNGDGNGRDLFEFRGDASNLFYRLEADWSGDAGVSVFDFTTFSYWFGLSVPTAPAYADISGDGGISVVDFSGFSNNFGVGVTYPTALQNAVAFVAAEDGRESANPSEELAEVAIQRIAPTDWVIHDRRGSVLAELNSELRGSGNIDWEALDDILGDILE